MNTRLLTIAFLIFLIAGVIPASAADKPATPPLSLIHISLLPAVQSIEKEVDGELGTLTDADDGFSKLSNKDGHAYAKISLDFSNLNGTLGAYELDVIEFKPTQLHPMPPLPMVKIDPGFQKIEIPVNGLSEADQAVLDPVLQNLKVDDLSLNF